MLTQFLTLQWYYIYRTWESYTQLKSVWRQCYMPEVCLEIAIEPNSTDKQLADQFTKHFDGITVAA